jgi:hypothetical protein
MNDSIKKYKILMNEARKKNSFDSLLVNKNDNLKKCSYPHCKRKCKTIHMQFCEKHCFKFKRNKK